MFISFEEQFNNYVQIQVSRFENSLPSIGVSAMLPYGFPFPI